MLGVILFLLTITIVISFIVCNNKKSKQDAISDGVYQGPNLDGYLYLGSDSLLQEIAPEASRYDISEEKSKKFWDLYHARNNDYTYYIKPVYDTEFTNYDDYYLLLS